MLLIKLETRVQSTSELLSCEIASRDKDMEEACLRLRRMRNNINGYYISIEYSIDDKIHRPKQPYHATDKPGLSLSVMVRDCLSVGSAGMDNIPVTSLTARITDFTGSLADSANA